MDSTIEYINKLLSSQIDGGLYYLYNITSKLLSTTITISGDTALMMTMDRVHDVVDIYLNVGLLCKMTLHAIYVRHGIPINVELKYISDVGGEIGVEYKRFNYVLPTTLMFNVLFDEECNSLHIHNIHFNVSFVRKALNIFEPLRSTFFFKCVSDKYIECEYIYEFRHHNIFLRRFLREYYDDFNEYRIASGSQIVDLTPIEECGDICVDALKSMHMLFNGLSYKFINKLLNMLIIIHV